MNYIDLFSGIGGFALGAYWAGMKFDNHYFSEVEPYAVELYQKRFPDAIPLGDITKHKEWKLEPGEYIITGGFPCQDISIAGAGVGLRSGARSILWFQMQTLIERIRPRFAIMENVGALTFRGLTDVLGSLAEIGYDAEWQDIRAADVGAPHKRERLWIIAYPEKGCDDVANAKKRELRTGFCENAAEGQRRGRSGNGCCKVSDSNGQGLAERKREDASRERTNSGSVFSGNPAWAIEPDVGRVAYGIPNRVDRLKGLGNAIIPQIAEILFRQISETGEAKQCQGM
jgi:DNA (cytosine-5)-methyltransferase 1